MGYTHYWTRPQELDRAEFRVAAEDCRRLCDASEIALQPVEGASEAVFREFIVAFQGGAEAFVVQCVCDETSPERPFRTQVGTHRGFCKTERLPYDICVQSCLIAFQHHFSSFAVSSDGEESDWMKARELCDRVLGYGRSFILADP